MFTSTSKSLRLSSFLKALLLISLLVLRRLFYLLYGQYLINSALDCSHLSITVSRAWHDDSTGNLLRHVKSCAPINSSQTRALAAYASAAKYTEASHRMKLTLWVAVSNHPFSIVEDKILLEIFTDLNLKCVTPLRQMVSKDVKEIFMLSRKEVGALLQVRLFFIRFLRKRL